MPCMDWADPIHIRRFGLIGRMLDGELKEAILGAGRGERQENGVGAAEASRPAGLSGRVEVFVLQPEKRAEPAIQRTRLSAGR
jgi:hypothetical protein